MTRVIVPIYPNIQQEKEFRRSKASARKLLPPLQLDKALQVYDLLAPQITDVVQFLMAHVYLIPVLVEARPRIIQIFDNCPVYLQVERDPDGGFEELFGVVRVDVAPKKALALLAQFDLEWFIRVNKRTRGRLNFTVEAIQ